MKRAPESNVIGPAGEITLPGSSAVSAPSESFHGGTAAGEFLHEQAQSLLYPATHADSVRLVEEAREAMTVARGKLRRAIDKAPWPDDLLEQLADEKHSLVGGCSNLINVIAEAERERS